MYPTKQKEAISGKTGINLIDTWNENDFTTLASIKLDILLTRSKNEVRL